ncbi:MAG: hypothetical protein CV081_07295 [Nitrospira sp. LK265]|nr:hypothetical protein [Nitrospira sp. LK265]
MARSAAFRSFARLMTAALLADRRKCSDTDIVETLQESTQAKTSPMISRRQFLLGAGATCATFALGTITGFPLRVTDAKPLPSSLSVGIVGAGLAGLACADTLKTRGIRTSIYDAATRTGGRCWSLRGFFPGQVAERGGELIDNSHKTMLGYAKRFGLTLEDVNRQPGDVFYYFFGQRYSEAAIVAEFRDFLSVMRRTSIACPEKSQPVHTQPMMWRWTVRICWLIWKGRTGPACRPVQWPRPPL